MKKNSAPKKSPSASTQCRLVETFWNFWPAFQRWSDSQTVEKRLTPQRTRILASLQEKGPQIMSDLKEQLGVTATNITALIDALEADGLVVRTPHPKDRRATVIELTADAECELMTQGCSIYRERVAELFSSLTEGDRKELLRMMETLKVRLETRV